MLQPTNAIKAMQAINVTVYKSLFMALFVLIAVGSVVVAVWSIFAYGWQDSVFVLLGSLLYIMGMFMVTGRGNVPLNESLLKTDSSSVDTESVWLNYYHKWTRLNTLRCALGMLAGMCWLLASYLVSLM